MLFNQSFIRIGFVIILSTTVIASCGETGCSSGDKPISILKNSITSEATISICRADNTKLTKKVLIKANQSITIVWPYENEKPLNPIMQSCATSESMRYSTVERAVLMSAHDQETYSLCSNGEIIQRGQACAIGSDLVVSSCPI